MNDKPQSPADAERVIFLESLEFESPEERAAFLDRACADNPDLRLAVENLLRHHQEDEFMRLPDARLASVSDLEAPGDRIGRYKLLQQIGEGGCGVVYMAEQEEPVRRRVALKVIKLGMDTKNVVARFEAERQALAVMDHPNIAKVFDAGATAAGRPFFVMELVPGVKITDYCDRHHLSTRERLELFIQVCQAIQHAHQKGIIHRDVKPSNILVTTSESGPSPKVIDFGIAKATTDQPLTDKTLFTAFEQFIGTPAYMSPEQAERTKQGIDTRSDIYSLGALLYELLTGRTPFDTQELLASGLEAMRRTIREREPERLSTRLRTMQAADLKEIAQRRQCEPEKMIQLVQGDLEWIATKCLEKDRTRRYETVNGLIGDIERHLNDEPVLARPPSGLDYIHKMIRRHTLAFAGAGVLAMTLLAGLGATTWMFLREKTAHQQALAAGIRENQMRQEAEAAQGRETSLRVKAQEMELAERHKAYALDMNLAYRAWDQGDLDRAMNLMGEYRPNPGEDDMRGFEWYYLWRLCHSDRLTLEGHKGLVRGVSFSPDGLLLATAGDDGTVRLWDNQTGKQLRLLTGQASRPASPVFSPDGKILATGGQNKTITLWDVSSGKELAGLGGHKLDVTALAFSPGGKWLVSASGSLANGNGNPYTRFVKSDDMAAEIKIWDVAARKELKTLLGHKRGILSLAVSPHSQTIASASADGTVELWTDPLGDLRTNQLVGFKGPVTAVAISPDGQSLAAGGGNPYQNGSVLKIFDLTTLHERVSLSGHEGPIFAVTFSPDGNTLASAGMDQVIRLWNSTTGEAKSTFKGHRASISSLSFDSSGERLASASWDGTAKVWDAGSRQGEWVTGTNSVYSTCYLPDESVLVAADYGLRILDPVARKTLFKVPNYDLEDPLVAISPDGKTLASGGQSNNLMLWEVGTWRPLADLSENFGTLLGLSFSPDGRLLACQDNVSVRLIQVADRRQIASFPKGASWTAILFTRDGKGLIWLDAGTTELVCSDVETGQAKWRLPGISECLALSPDGRWLALTVGADVEMVDVQTREVRWRSSGHTARLWGGSFSPDGKTLATACWDGTCKLWNTGSGQEMLSYRASGVVWGAHFSPKGDQLAIGAGSKAQGNLTLLQAATPAEISAYETPPQIDLQPASQTISEGGGVTLDSAASGKGPITFQWRLGETNLPGQNSPSLRLVELSAAAAGPYTVVARNPYHAVTSSVASVIVQPVRETSAMEADFKEKQPARYFVAAASEKKVPIPTHDSIQAGAGRHGGPALVMIADGSALTNSIVQDWAHFRGDINLNAGAASGIDTTNLNLYRMEVTARTEGLSGTESHGRVIAQFLAPSRALLTISIPATFTSNYQDYSFVLGSGRIDSWEPGSWNSFVGGLAQINMIKCALSADNWGDDYDVTKPSAFYIDHVKFVRLTSAQP